MIIVPFDEEFIRIGGQKKKKQDKRTKKKINNKYISMSMIICIFLTRFHGRFGYGKVLFMDSYSR